MLRDQPPRPANMTRIVAINQGRRPYSTRLPRVERLSSDRVRAELDGGSVVLDTRAHESFGEYHIPRAFNAQQSSGSFEQNAGWILPEDRPVLLAVDDPASVPTAVRKLAFVGLDSRIAGFVDMPAWRAEGMPCSGVPTIDVHDLHRRLGSGDESIQLLDVRESSEWLALRIEASRHTNFKHLLLSGGSMSVVPDHEVAVICVGGMRSSTACSILRRLGFERVYNVAGGIGAWQEAGFPLAGSSA